MLNLHLSQMSENIPDYFFLAVYCKNFLGLIQIWKSRKTEHFDGKLQTEGYIFCKLLYLFESYTARQLH